MVNVLVLLNNNAWGTLLGRFVIGICNANLWNLLIKGQ